MIKPLWFQVETLWGNFENGLEIYCGVQNFLGQRTFWDITYASWAKMLKSRQMTSPMIDDQDVSLLNGLIVLSNIHE